MSYSIKVVRKADYNTRLWSGGTTTELLIYPTKAIYGKDHFKWRLSSAKIDLDESTFTILPNITRIIMTLSGELTLTHDNGTSVFLNPFTKYSFKGDWETKSKGKVIDFNLMMDENCTGDMEVLSLQSNETIIVTTECNNTKMLYNNLTEVFFIVNGPIKASTDMGETTILYDNDLILINSTQDFLYSKIRFTNYSKNHCKIIRTIIEY